MIEPVFMKNFILNLRRGCKGAIPAGVSASRDRWERYPIKTVATRIFLLKIKNTNEKIIGTYNVCNKPRCLKISSMIFDTGLALFPMKELCSSISGSKEKKAVKNKNAKTLLASKKFKEKKAKKMANAACVLESIFILSLPAH